MIPLCSRTSRAGRIFYCLCTEGSGRFGAILKNPFYIYNISLFFLYERLEKPVNPPQATTSTLLQNVNSSKHFRFVIPICANVCTFSEFVLSNRLDIFRIYFVHSSGHFRFIIPKWEIDFLF